MPYIHRGRGKVRLLNDPIDPDSTDWFYFPLGEWLETNETITSHGATVVNGTKVTDSTYYASRVDSRGVTQTEVYGVQAKPSAGVTEMEITLRVSTDAGRLNHDFTMQIPVKEQ